jgi:hypothetical protein
LFQSARALSPMPLKGFFMSKTGFRFDDKEIQGQPKRARRGCQSTLQLMASGVNLLSTNLP